MIDIEAEPLSRKHTAATLQGLVNRKRARVFLSDGEGSFYVNDYWLDYYVNELGIRLAWRGGLEGALRRFRSEIDGYLLVSADEPWTVNVATTVAYDKNAIVVDERDVGLVEGLGIPRQDSFVGRWTDARTASRETEEAYYARMPHRSIAVQSPGRYELRDFLTQQGIFTLYSRPSLEDWPMVPSLFERIPDNVPIYGYMSNDAVEEVIAILSISMAGKFLVPTSTTANLSFHCAVTVAEEAGRRASPEASALLEADGCPDAELIVTIAISDGDNVRVPISYPKWDGYWGSADRGRLPIGWSLNDSLFALAPAVADYLRDHARSNEDVVSLMGVGYVLNDFHPDPEWNWRVGFEAMEEHGLEVYWSLSPLLEIPTYSLWNVFEATRRNLPTGVLVGYRSLFGINGFRTPGGIPVLVAGGSYEDDSADFARRIRETLALPRVLRPRVVFLSATSWNHTYDSLVRELLPR